MHRLSLCIFTWLCYLITPLKAQNAVFPNPGTVFNGNLNVVSVLIHPDTLKALLAQENRWTNHSYPATFVYNNTDTVKLIGIRIKGNSSRNAKKLSFKLDFDEFINQTYQGLKTVNLNGNNNDPSLCREYLSAYVMQKAGNACLRVNHVKLFLNGVYSGVYTMAEQVDKIFLNSRYNQNSGNLYKCTWPANLKWINDNPESYKNIINPSPLNERAYDLKTNESLDDYTGLVHFIKVINRSTAGAFKQAIDSVFEVDAYLKTLATEILVGHWDNYFLNKNNYYLYQQKNGKFTYIPYDMDNTYGIQWGIPNIAIRHVNQWGNNDVLEAQLTYRILGIPEYKKQFEIYLKQLCTNVFNADSLFTVVDLLKENLTSAISTDPYYSNQWPSDYGFNFSDWQNAFTQPGLSHVSYGVKPYIAQRCSSALAQIPASTGMLNQTFFDNIKIYPNPANNIITIGVDEPLKLMCYNQHGKFVGAYFTNKLNCFDWPNGIYLLQIIKAQQTQVVRIVVNHNE